MYQNNPLLSEAIKLDPSKIDSYLKNSHTKKILMQAKSRIHKNPYLRNKFYDVTTLYHITPSSNVNSIKKTGLKPKIGNQVKDFIGKNKIDSLVYTTKREPYMHGKYSGISTIKIRIPNSELRKSRVPDPIEQGKRISQSYQNYFTGSALKDYPITKGIDMYGRPVDLEKVLKKISEDQGRVITPKEFRKMWSKADKKERYKLGDYFVNYYRSTFHPNTVALKTRVKPEWIVGSSVAKKYNFEDQLRKDPERTISMINDLMKRK